MSNIPRVAFRADGSQASGLGHIMRCLSFARAFQHKGCHVSFICRHDLGAQKVMEAGFSVLRLKASREEEIPAHSYYYGDEKELETEADEILQELSRHPAEILVIDSYNISKEYFLRLKSGVRKLAYIDDVNKFPYPVDILINGNVSGPEMGYQPFSKEEILLLGTEYNLIRDEFRQLPPKVIRKVPLRVMITSGGSDPFGMSGKLAKDIAELSGIEIHILVGAVFHNKQPLYELAEMYPRIFLHENVQRVSDMMLDCDVAISSGGSTLYELCACGTPTLALILAENQVAIVNKMEQLGYVTSLGWHYQVKEKMWVGQLTHLLADYELRLKLCNRMRNLVDGKGALRAAEAVLSTIAKV